MKKTMKKTCGILFSVATIICFAASGLMFASCDKNEEGMNDENAFYTYQARSTDFNYQDAAGVFDTAIRFSVGLEPILGGADDRVKEVCDECYENLKPVLQGKKGKVEIMKTRHPDGKQMVLREYKFN